MANKPFLTDIKTLRSRARQHIEEGAVTPAYEGDTKAAIKVLNDALATEVVCVLRYKLHYFVAKGIHAGPVADEFLEHANDEQRHADMISERIVQLGGDPDLSPDGLLSRSHTEYVATDQLVKMIKENLIAERIAIDSYREIAAYFAPFDPTSRKMIEEILAEEESHADDLADLLRGLPEDLRH
jgi:bacterioferritin